MSRVLLLLSCYLLCAPTATVTTRETIAPQHSIKYQERGWYSLSRDGRWFAIKYSEGGQPVQLFDLNKHPAREFTAQEHVFSGMTFGFDRWFVGYADPKHSDSKNPGYRIWDLAGTSGHPALILGMRYHGLKVNVSGTHLAAVHKNADNVRGLRIWDLRKPALLSDDYRELATIGGNVSASAFLFTAGRGIIAINENSLARWDLDALDKPPVTVPLDKEVKSVSSVESYWSEGDSDYVDPCFVSWKDKSGKTRLTDLPHEAAKHHVWEIVGRPVACNGKVLVEDRKDECWLTRIDGPSASSTKLFGSASQDYNTVLFLKHGEYLLVNNLDWFVTRGDYLTRIQTYVFSLADPKAPPIILDNRGETKDGRPRMDVQFNDFYCSYVTSPADKWLLGLSEAKTTLWDLSKPIRAEGIGSLAGIEGMPVAHSLIGKRWLILRNKGGRLYYVDLNSDTVPIAVEFFNLGSSSELSQVWEAAESKFFAVDVAAKTVHIWDVADFERVLPKPAESQKTASPKPER